MQSKRASQLAKARDGGRISCGFALGHVLLVGLKPDRHASEARHAGIEERQRRDSLERIDAIMCGSVRVLFALILPLRVDDFLRGGAFAGNVSVALCG